MHYFDIKSKTLNDIELSKEKIHQILPLFNPLIASSSWMSAIPSPLQLLF